MLAQSTFSDVMSGFEEKKNAVLYGLGIHIPSDCNTRSIRPSCTLPQLAAINQPQTSVHFGMQYPGIPS